MRLRALGMPRAHSCTSKLARTGHSSGALRSAPPADPADQPLRHLRPLELRKVLAELLASDVIRYSSALLAGALRDDLRVLVGALLSGDLLRAQRDVLRPPLGRGCNFLVAEVDARCGWSSS
jgi:hypothetical protein